MRFSSLFCFFTSTVCVFYTFKISLFYFIEYDECLKDNHGCGHICVNTLGGFRCECEIGYELHSDGKKCEGRARYICHYRFLYRREVGYHDNPVGRTRSVVRSKIIGYFRCPQQTSWHFLSYSLHIIRHVRHCGYPNIE